MLQQCAYIHDTVYNKLLPEPTTAPTSWLQSLWWRRTGSWRPWLRAFTWPYQSASTLRSRGQDLLTAINVSIQGWSLKVRQKQRGAPVSAACPDRALPSTFLALAQNSRLKSPNVNPPPWKYIFCLLTHFRLLAIFTLWKESWELLRPSPRKVTHLQHLHSQQKPQTLVCPKEAQATSLGQL